MKWKEWLETWSMSSLKINAGFLEMDWSPKDKDKDAAWDLYIELLTRITTQPLPDDVGVEETALESVHKIFGITREVIRHHGRDCIEFTKIAIVVLNQIIRPFTSKWHKELIGGEFENEAKRSVFRKELKELQSKISTYAGMLAQMAGVEDLSNLEKKN